MHTYLPGPHRGVWNEEALLVSKEIILCESIIDALTFWCAGFRNVTASYGVHGFTEDHRNLFQKHGVQQVWIAYDRDDAGDQAAGRLKEELLALGIGSHRVLFPKGMDANEYARQVTPASQSLAVLLNSATWWEKGKPAAKEKSGPPPDPEPVSLLAADPQPAPEPVPMPEAITPEPGMEAPRPVIPFAAEPEIDIDGDEIIIPRGDRRYRIRGLAKNLSPEVIKVNLLCHGRASSTWTPSTCARTASAPPSSNAQLKSWP